MRPRIQAIVDELLDAIDGHRDIDVIADLAYPPTGDGGHGVVEPCRSGPVQAVVRWERRSLEPNLRLRSTLCWRNALPWPSPARVRVCGEPRPAADRPGQP